MEADKWYKYTVALSGSYTISAKTADIIETTNGSQLMSEATGGAVTTGDDVTLTAGDVIYYKSSSNNQLTIEANVKTYIVGTATADLFYIKEGNTITVTWADAVSNDGDAVFAINGTPAITFGGNAIDITTTATGFTFTIPEVSINTTYTLSIPADAFGYAKGSTYNEAQNISFQTPLIADGDYYLKSKSNNGYFAGGNGWGTQAITNNLGHIVNLTALNNGNYTINTYLFNGGTSSANHFLNGLWCDGASAEWTFAADGEYYTINDGTNNLTAGNIGEVMTLASGTGDNTKWQLLTLAQWKAENVARLDAANADNGVDATFYLAAPNFNRNDDLENAKWQGSPTISGFADGSSQNFNAQKYNTTPFDVYQELTGLKPGVYKVTMQGFYRNGTTDDQNVYLYANDESVALANIRSTAIEAQDNDKGFTTQNGDNYVPYTQTDASKAFNNNYYKSELVFSVATDGALRIGVKKTTGASKDWAVFDNFQLFYYGTLDYSALETAYNAVSVPTLGFEDGEYAPYVNAENINNIALAKSMLDNENATSQTAIDNLKNAIASMTWTANTAEVNAIYWKTDYTTADKAEDGYVHPLGWTNTGYNTRVINSELTADKAMETIGTAVFSKFNTTYGETTGYTMPLKAGKIYKITFKYCGWGNNPTTNIVLTDPESNTITLAPGFKPATKDGNTDASHWYDYTGYFVSTTAGDYVLAMNKVESGQQQIAWANMQLVSASELEFADGAVPTYAPGTYPSVKITRELTKDRWATAVYPFAVSGVSGLTIANLDSYDKTSGELGFSTTAAASTANVPFLMRSTAAKSEISLSNVAVAAAAATDVTKSEASLKGVYAATDITNAEKNYVLSNNVIYVVGENKATINPYRAYIQIAQPTSARLRFVIDGNDATGIESIAAETGSVLDGQVYDLSGRLVKNPTKGLYIVNGKKVLVK
jgi:hypothetical protein